MCGFVVVWFVHFFVYFYGFPCFFLICFALFSVIMSNDGSEM